MPTVTVDDRGTAFYYEDTGPPEGSHTYLTVILMHGLLFHGGEQSLSPWMNDSYTRFLRDVSIHVPYQYPQTCSLFRACILEVGIHGNFS